MPLPTHFLLVVIASGGLALLALVRKRPATFIFAASQTMLVRALARFSEQGRPDSLLYAPRWVFSREILGTAAIIVTLSTLLLAVFTALPSREGRLDPRTLPPLPRWMLWTLAGYFLLVVVSQRWIFSVGYASDEQQILSTPIGGVQTLMSSMLLYEICRRVWVEQWSAARGLLTVAVVFVFTDYLRGATGIATGYIVVTAFLLWQPGATRVRTALRVLALLVAVSGFAMMVRMTRTDVHERGFASVQTAADNMLAGGSGEGLDEAASTPQFAAHVLDCVALYDGGKSREWRSLSDPIIFTFEPAFLTGPLGIERPVSAPWEMGSYFLSLGGISIFGEAYWNGGYLGVVVFIGGLLALCYFCDTRFRSSYVWLVMLLNVGPVLLAGVNYGVSYEFRAVVNGLLQLAIFRFVFARKAAPRVPVLVGRGVVVPTVASPAEPAS